MYRCYFKSFAMRSIIIFLATTNFAYCNYVIKIGYHSDQNRDDILFTYLRDAKRDATIFLPYPLEWVKIPLDGTDFSNKFDYEMIDKKINS